MFSHEKLIVYQRAIEWLTLATTIARSIAPGSGDIVPQLKRAALSVVLNIAEAPENRPSQKGKDSLALPEVPLFNVLLSSMLFRLFRLQSQPYNNRPEHFCIKSPPCLLSCLTEG